MVTLDAIRGPVAQELEEFDAFVRRNFKVENELLSGMVDYILSSRGKGVRPLLVLLSAALAVLLSFLYEKTKTACSRLFRKQKV
ncbi:hypothetical protein [Alistipes communis]